MFITTRVIFKKVLVELSSPSNSQNTQQASFIKLNLHLRDGGRGRPAAWGQVCNAQGGHRKRASLQTTFYVCNFCQREFFSLRVGGGRRGGLDQLGWQPRVGSVVVAVALGQSPPNHMSELHEFPCVHLILGIFPDWIQVS